MPMEIFIANRTFPIQKAPEVSLQLSADLHAVNPVSRTHQARQRPLGIVCLCAVGNEGFVFDVL